MAQVDQTNVHHITVQEFAFTSVEFNKGLLETFKNYTLRIYEARGLNWRQQRKDYREWVKELRAYFNFP